jgi:tRNA 2-thiouridine synthesizing protein A
MTEKTLNLRGLKCPLPALRTKKALAGIDIPNLLSQTGDTLEATRKEKRLLTFRIRKT